MKTSENHASKEELRLEARRRRGGLDPAWRAAASVDVARHVLGLADRRPDETIALFASFGEELDTHHLIGELLARGRRLVLPVALRAQRRLELRRVDEFPAACRPGPFGILEPDPLLCPEIVHGEAVGLMLVPGLLFTRDGWRLGYGAGFYDRLLQDEPPGFTVGLAFSQQLVPDLPREPWDRPVDLVCTEAGFIGINAR